MQVVRGYKTELDLNNVQRTACLKHAGCARFAYNWGPARKIAAYKAGEKVPSAIDLHRELNTLKPTEYPWMYEVSKCAPQEALRDLDKAYANFFRKAKLKKAGQFKGKLGFPQFKKKSKAIGSFRLTGSIKVFIGAVHLPRIGTVRLHEHGYLPTNAKILSATVSEQAGRWYVSVQVEEEHEKAVADSNFGEIRRQLEYKSAWHGTQIITIDRFYPSSKTCSACGYVKPELRLSERTFLCEACRNVLDRDLNAAINLMNVAVSSIDTQNACGVGSGFAFWQQDVKLPTVKQEPTHR